MIKPGSRAKFAFAGVATVLFLTGGALVWRPAGELVRGRPARDVHSLLPRQRRFEPRLAVSDYGPLDSLPPEAPRSDDVETWTAIANLEKFAQKPGSREAARSAALGLAALYRGDTDGALEELRDAAYLEPNAAAYWCDLAAASLVRGRPTDLLVALDAAEMSLRLEPVLEPAAFDRALALERLGLLDDARDEWQAFQRNSRTSGWIAEARDHAARVARQLEVVEFAITADDVLRAGPDQLAAFAAQGLGDLRRIVEEDLLPRLAGACGAQHATECADLLKRIETVAAAAAIASPDRELPALALQLARWTPAQIADPKRTADMIAYGNAVRLFQEDEVQQSVEIFRRLAAASAPIPAPLRANAAQYECIDYYLRSDHAHARTCYDALAREAERGHLLLLQGGIESNRAQVSLTEGNLERASVEFDQASALYAQARERNLVAISGASRATLLDQLGSLDDAWRDRVTALTNARLPPRRRHTTLNSGARSAFVQRLFRAALAFEQAAIRNATNWGQPGALVETLLNRAVIFQRLGRTQEALADLQSAREQFLKISDPHARSRFESELAVMEGEVLSESTPAAGIPVLQKASDRLTSMQFGMVRARVEYALGVAEERIGNRASARAAYRRGVEVIERQRDPLAAATQMQSVDLVWDMYERLFTRRLEDEGGAAAFESAEAGRARVLRRFLPVDAPAIPSLPDIPGLLPANAAFLYFVVTEHETVRWWISRSGAELTRFPIERAQLDYQVRKVRRTLTSRSSHSLSLASAALSELVAPPHDRVLPGTRLIVFPDGPLHDLPFAAVLQGNGRHLIQDYPVGIAPSVRLFFAASRSATRFAALDSVLVVKGRTGPGDPPLAALPSADDEVRQIQKIYAGARVVSDETATPGAFLSEAGAYSIVHFTGHAIADRRNPDRSRLFLQPSSSDPRGWLLVRDLEVASFDRTALVVLAACDTGAGRVFRGEGAVSLARPFLGKGVAAVVSSLWEVADRPSAQLLLAFYEGVRAGLEPIVALQQAQRRAAERVASGESAASLPTWAAFQYVGGLKPDGLQQQSGGLR